MQTIRIVLPMYMGVIPVFTFLQHPTKGAPHVYGGDPDLAEYRDTLV